MTLFFEWGDHLTLGVPALDQQHRELVEFLNLMAGKLTRPKEALPTLERLYRASREHFSYEEKLMTSVGYGAVALHSHEHVMLLGELKAVIGRVRDGHDAFDHETLHWLKEWVIAHIVGSDREFATYMASAEAAAEAEA